MPSPTRRNQDVANLRTFKDTNKYATTEAGGRLYVVRSYGEHWPLFVHDKATGMWLDNEDKYGVTTSKHRSQCYPYGVPDTDIERASCRYMKEYIAKVCDAERITDFCI